MKGKADSRNLVDEISLDSGKIVYGVDDTLKALEASACETIIVYENLEITRWVLRPSVGANVVIHTNKGQEGDREMFMDKETGQEMEIVEQTAFLEWLAESYKDYGASLEFVSDRSSEGNQFVKGFGGIGAMLRYSRCSSSSSFLSGTEWTSRLAAKAIDSPCLSYNAVLISENKN